MAKPAPAPLGPGWSEQDCLLAPAKPRHVELLAGERESSGFAVTQPGPIRLQM